MTTIEPTPAELLTVNNYINKDRKKFKQLSFFVDLVLQENNNHNLIGKNTINNVWTRHVIDSLQLTTFINNSDNIVDVGSGAGFPAIILGIATQKKIIMVEKSPVKAHFLSSVCKKLNLSFDIINKIIDKTNIQNAIPQKSVLTARAFKSIYDILSLVEDCNNLKKIVLLKGDGFQTEINECEKKNKILLQSWTFAVKNSITNQGVVIIFDKNT